LGWQAVRVTVDTNLLVRYVVQDDRVQATTAFKILTEAELLAVSLTCLCELAWVLDRVYRFPRDRIASAIRTLADSANVATDMAAVETGLRIHDLGGDFADGVIAAAGAGMGGDTFVSFDRKAIARLGAMGMSATHADEFA
jgi:predicted nucleic-acid-binding protein